MQQCVAASWHTSPEVLILSMQWFHAKNKSPVSAGSAEQRYVW